MAINKNSNLYIIVYSTIMVVVVALLLAVASLSLSERQQTNILNEKRGAILASLGVDVEQIDITTYYNENIDAFVVNNDGERIEGDAIALLGDLKGAFESGTYPIFAYKQGGIVVPLTGSGLWGPIWGYLALESDMNTVKGVVMDHSGETPGLGAEITTSKHQDMYVGKTIFDGDELVAIKLVKGGATPGNMHEVDAITGGTKTSDGVSAMLYNSLSNYLGYFKQSIAAQQAPAQEETPIEEAITEVSNELNTAENE